jgi:hypothetical protein
MTVNMCNKTGYSFILLILQHLRRTKSALKLTLIFSCHIVEEPPVLFHDQTSKRYRSFQNVLNSRFLVSKLTAIQRNA